jgi:uncharacterized protein YndB with AHSA1/START domain
LSLKIVLQAAGCWLFFLSASLCSASGDAPVSVVLTERDSYTLNAQFIVPVPPQNAWNVLTDYDHLSQFVHSMKGHIRSEKGDDLLVNQVATGGFLFFTVSVSALLLIHEEPIHDILFTDTTGKDFKSYSGSWNLLPIPQGTQITYQLKAEKNKNTPGFVTGKILQSTTRDLLNELRMEMERREVIIQKDASSPTKIVNRVTN